MTKTKVGVYLSFLVLITGIVFTTSTIEAYSLPDLRYPWDSSLNGSIKFTSGPHEYGNTNGKALVNRDYLSGIDFSGGSLDPACSYQCGYTVANMSAGTVTFVGLGGLGRMVAVQLDGTSVTLVYGHLYSYDSDIEQAYLNNETIHLDRGDPIGRVGGTGPSGNKEWPVHLHVELRDGGACSTHCMSGTDLRTGVTVNGFAGNPLSWEGEMINGYHMYIYCTNSSCTSAYNYDGVAVTNWWGSGPPFLYSGFSYTDSYTDGSSPEIRNNVYIWGVPVDQMQCNSGENCAQQSKLPQNLQSEIRFTGNGLDGGGSTVDSTNTLNTSSGGSSGTGDDPVDFREDPNYGGGQYGNSANPRTIINFDGWANDIMSSVQIDSGYSTMVFTHSNGQGGKRCLVTSIPDLQYVTLDDGSNANNALSSFIWYDNANCDGQYSPYVASGDSVTVYAGFNWEGTQYGGSGTNQFNLPDYIEGAVSSIGVLPGNSAIVYQLDFQQGGARCFSASDSDLRDNYYDNGQVVDDNMHSLKLFTDTNCGGWTPAAPTATYTPIPTETPTNTPVPAPQVTLLVLVNADTELDIAAMYEGMVIDVAAIGTNNFSIRAEAVNTESVVFGLDGNPSYSTESNEPYAINGDNGPSDYYAWTPALGAHSVSATAYSEDSGAGIQGTTLSYNFSVVNNVTETPTATPTETPTSTPVPVNLVYNPSFEIVSGSFPDNWSTGSGLVTLDQSSNGNDGSNSIHFAPTNDYITLVSGGFSVTAGQTYTFSFYAKSGSGTGSFGLRADFSDENWSYVTSDTIGTLGADVNGVATYTYTIPAGVAHMSLQFYSNAGTQFDVYIDSVVVQ